MIYVIRHGETPWNALGLIQGQRDIDLSEEGIKQVHQVKEQFKNVLFTHAFSSDLKRAYDTAKILLSHQKEIEITKTPALREGNYGVWEGMPFNDLKIKYPDEFFRFQNGETLYELNIEGRQDLLSRSLPVFDQISSINSTENVLVVTHGGLMKTLVRHFLERKDFPQIKIHNLGYFVMENKTPFQVVNMQGITIEDRKEVCQNCSCGCKK